MFAALLTLAAVLAQSTDPDALLEQGMSQMKAGDTAAALETYKNCLSVSAEHVGCHWEIGWAYWKGNDWESVVRHWQLVERLDPTHGEVQGHLNTAEGQLAVLTAARDAAAGAPATVRPPLPAGTTIRIRAVGDIMLGSDFPNDGAHLPPDGGEGSFTDVTSLLSDADLTFGNLEGPLCDGGTTHKCKPGQNCYAFRTPTAYGAFIDQAGFDLLSTANNHAEDFGMQCRTETETTLAGLGIAFSGRPGTIASVEHDNVKVAMIGFHSSRNSHYINDHEAAAALVRSVDQSHDLVIVSFHGGAEGSKAIHVPDAMEIFYGEKRGHLRVFARTVVQAGADLVLGHGPHVPRGLEVVDGRLIAYSLGNFATYGRFNLSGHLGTSLVLEATLDAEGKLVAGQILPVKQIGEGRPVPDDEGVAIDLVRSLSTEDFGARAPTIAQDGTFAPPG